MTQRAPTIPCPKCGAATHVKETRGNTRRRWCTDFACDGRVTTAEIDLNAFKRLLGGDDAGRH